MSLQENKDIARKFIDTMDEGHFGLLSEDCIFLISGNSIYSGPKSKRDMIESFAAVKSIVDGNFNIKPSSFIAEGDRVAVEAESHVMLKDGRLYNNKYFMLFTIKEGRIIDVREYNDTAHVNDTFGAAS